MRNILFAAAALALVASPAQADYIGTAFAFGTGPVQLVLNGGQATIDATATGWVNANGLNNHDGPVPANTAYDPPNSYFVGSYDVEFRDFFTFDLGSISTPITSAVLKVWCPNDGVTALERAEFSVYDATSALPSIFRNSTALFSSLTAGLRLGYFAPIDGNSDAAFVNVAFNAQAVALLNGYAGGQFAVGGAILDTQAPIPATLPMLAGAMLFTGWRARRKCLRSVG